MDPGEPTEHSDPRGQVLERLHTGGGLLPTTSGEDLQLQQLLGSILGGYRVTGLLGRGGMGLVLRAERIVGDFERQVAIKVVAETATPEWLAARFADERNILAGLNHPGIAQLYDSGHTPQGWPYLVMELVDGVSADEYCRQNQLGAKAVVRLLLKVAAAVSYAHSRLVVHRDIKPSNVLVPNNGEPKLLDFGVAKLISPELSKTTQGQRPMTPRYASPEQLLGGDITTSSDVYQLGLLLWCLLGNQPPFEQSSPEQVLSDATTDPNLTGQPGAQSWPELTAIVTKCLRADPSGRYAAVAELQNDLRAFLDGYPVQAVRGAWSYKVRRWVQRNRMTSAMGLFLLIGSTVGLVSYTRGINQAAERANVQAELAAAEAEKARRIATFLKGIFEVTDPEHANRQTTLRELVDNSVLRISSSFEAEPEIAIELLLDIGTNYRAQGAYERAAEVFQIALQLAETRLEQSNDLVAEIHERYGRLLGFSLDPAGAMHLRKALELRRTHLGTHRNTADTLGSLAVTLREVKGGHAEAIDLLREADQMYSELQVEDNVDTLAIPFILAQLLLDEGKFAGALTLFKDNLARQERVNGRLDVRSIIHSNLAQAALGAGQLEEAKDHVTRALELVESLHDEPMADTASVLTVQALVFHALQQHSAAHAALERALSINKSLYGESKPSYVNGLRLRADFYLAAGQNEAALADATRADKLASTSNHATLPILTATTLAHALRAAGQNSASSNAADQAYSNAIDALGLEHRYTRAAAVAVAEALLTAGEPDRAAAVLQAHQAASASDHPDLRIALLSALGQTRAQQGQTAAARTLLNSALEAARNLGAGGVVEQRIRDRLRRLSIVD